MAPLIQKLLELTRQKSGCLQLRTAASGKHSFSANLAGLREILKKNSSPVIPTIHSIEYSI